MQRPRLVFRSRSHRNIALIAIYLIGVAASLLGATVLLNQASPPPSTPPTPPPVITQQQVTFSASSGSTGQDAETCHNTLAVAANSVLIIAATQYTDNTLTFAVHGSTATSLKTSTASTTYPYAQIEGLVVTSAATITYYVNYTSNIYYDCFGADFTTTSVNSTFTSGTAAMTNANTTAITACGTEVTTTVANEMIFGVWGDKTTHAYSVTYTLTTSETELNTESTTTDIDYGEDAYYLKTTAGPTGMNATATQALDSGGACVGILPTSVPPKPTSLSVGSPTTTSLTATWTNYKGPDVNNTVYAYTSATCASGLTSHSTSGEVASYAISSLSSATEYGVTVSTWNSTGESVHTACSDGTTLPTAPTISSATPASTTSVTVDWTNPSGTLTNDYVFYELGSSCTSATQDTVGSVTTTYTVTGLTTNKLYCFYVEAVSAGGASAASSTLTAITESVPAAPTSLAAGTTTTTTIPLTWSNPTTGGLTNSTVYWYSGGSCSGSVSVHSAGSAVTSYTITGLTTNKEYSATVSAWNATGESPHASCVTAITATVPAAPTGLAATVPTTTSITWTWTNPGGGGLTDSYLYWQSGTACSSPTTVNIGSVVTSYDLTGLSVGTEYCAYAEAANATGSSAASSTVDGWTLPAAPTGLTVGTITTTSIALSWTNPGTTLTDSYVYWQSGSACSSATKIDLGSVSTSYTKTGLSSNSEYCFYVEAVNAGGASAASSTVVAITATVPAAPTGLTVSSVTQTTMSLSWSNPSGGGLVNSTVYRYSGGSCSGSVTVVSVGSAVTSETISGLTANREYSVAASAWNGTGESAHSSCVTGITATVPAAPTGLTVGATTQTTIPLSWSNPGGGGLTNSTIYWYSGGSCSGSVSVHSAGSAVASYTISGLTSNEEYSASVSAWNSTGESPHSSCVTGITMTVPAAPTGLSATAPTVSSITWTWTNPGGGGLTDNYLFWEAGTSCSSPTEVNIGSVVTSYDLTGLSGATEYCAYVEAANATGSSLASPTATGWTIPAAPTGLSVTGEALATISLGWTNPSGTLTDSYVYWQSGSACSAATKIDVGSVVTSRTVSGLTTNKEYCFYVEAVDAAGASAASSMVIGITASVPAAPTSLTSPSQTSSSISLSWVNPATGGLTNSTVYWYAGSSCTGTVTAISEGSAVTSGTITGLMGSETICVSVSVWNATGQSPNSTSITATTQAGGSIAAPTSLAEVSYGTTWVNVSWVNVGSPVNNTIYLAPLGFCGDWNKFISTGGPVQSFNITGLVPGDSYCIAVTSWNSVSQSLSSNNLQVATMNPGQKQPSNPGGGGPPGNQAIAQLSGTPEEAEGLFILGVVAILFGLVVLLRSGPTRGWRIGASCSVALGIVLIVLTVAVVV